MTEDSGGAARYTLTAEEEAALLADYGTEGPFDDGIDWGAAPSHFRSELGGGDVFLTGAADQADDDADAARQLDNSSGVGVGSQRASRQPGQPAHTDPLTLYLLRYAPSVIVPTRSTPSSLAQPMSQLLSTLESSGGESGRTHDASRFAPVLRCGREWERRASLAVQGMSTSSVATRLLSAPQRNATVALGEDAHATPSASPITEGSESAAEVERGGGAAPIDAEYATLIAATERLLGEADAALAQHSAAAAPQAGAQEAAETQRCIEELERREALLSEDVVDQYWERQEVLDGDDEEATTRDLLQRAQEHRQRLRAALDAVVETVPTLSGGSTGEADAAALTDTQKLKETHTLAPGDRPPTRSCAVPFLDYLFAFEMELPRQPTQVPRDSSGMKNSVSEDTSSDARFAAAKDEAVPLTSYENVPALPRPSLTTLTASTAVPPTPLHAEETSIPQLLVRSAAVLQAITAAEERDLRTTQQHAEQQEKQKEQAATLNGAPSRTSRSGGDALGLVVLPGFVKRLDELFAPSAEERKERLRHAREAAERQATSSTANGDGNKMPSATPHSHSIVVSTYEYKGATEGLPAHNEASAAKETAVASLEQIRRQAALESFLLAREMEEGRRMRCEDEAVERAARAAAERAVYVAEQTALLQEAEGNRRGACVAEEVAAWREVLRARVRDAALARQLEQLRRLQAAEALAYTLTLEWETSREQVVQAEALAIRETLRTAEESRARAATTAEHRIAAEAAASQAQWEELLRAFETTRAALTSQGALTAKEGGTRDTKTPSSAARHSRWFQWRIYPLLRECAALRQWLGQRHKAIEGVRGLLEEAKEQFHRHVAAAAAAAALVPKSDTSMATTAAAPALRVPASPPRVSAPVGGARVLTRETALQLLWPSFHAAVADPALASQLLASWSLALEELTGVDWTSLHALVLQGESHTTDGKSQPAQRAIDASRLVREVDLSSNTLGALDVVMAVQAFPSLQRLCASHAAVQTLEGGVRGGGDDAHGPRGSVRGGSASLGGSTVRDGTGRLSSSASSARLRHVSAARSHALAEQVHLLSVDLTSNKLTSLHPLGMMATASLTRCTATDNQLASLDSVATCAQLRGLTVPHNALTSIQGLQGLRLLRELDGGNNQLSSFDFDAEVRDASSAASADSVSVLATLYLSHNKLRRLPSRSFFGVFPCLSRLFVNHNALTVLDAESMAWFPLLSVLQAEGNALVDISGLAQCVRLSSLRLSFNQLASTAALSPLAACRSLRSLDIGGNPFMTSKDSHDDSQRVTEVLLAMLPALEELDGATVGITAESRSQRPAEASTLDDPLKARRLSFSPCVVYGEVFAALCWDARLRDVQRDRELQEALLARDVNRAKGFEAALVAKRRGRQGDASQVSDDTEGPWLKQQLYSMTAAQRDVRQAELTRELRLFELDARSLDTWLSIGGAQAGSAYDQPTTLSADTNDTRAVASGVAFANRHTTHLAYQHQEDDAYRRAARAYMAEWLLSRVVVRRAQKQLRALRHAFQQSEAFRREAAARRIQPIWRGAALRSRLRRLLHGPRDDDDHDESFVKVDVHDWLTEDASALAPVELLLQTVVDAARDVAAVPFDVPPVAAELGGAAPRLPASISSVAPSTTFTPVPPHEDGRRPRTGTAASGRPTPHAPPPRSESATTNAPPAVDEEWGPGVAAQLRKKQHKQARANNERLRKEFMQDPLRVQHEMRGGASTRKPRA